MLQVTYATGKEKNMVLKFILLLSISSYCFAEKIHTISGEFGLKLGQKINPKDFVKFSKGKEETYEFTPTTKTPFQAHLFSVDPKTKVIYTITAFRKYSTKEKAALVHKMLWAKLQSYYGEGLDDQSIIQGKKMIVLPKGKDSELISLTFVDTKLREEAYIKLGLRKMTPNDSKSE